MGGMVTNVLGDVGEEIKGEKSMLLYNISTYTSIKYEGSLTTYPFSKTPALLLSDSGGDGITFVSESPPE